MSLYWSNKQDPKCLPLVGITFVRWQDSEYMEDLPGYHLTIQWGRGEWWGSRGGDIEYWKLRGKPMCYRKRICFEFNWPRVWWHI